MNQSETINYIDSLKSMQIGQKSDFELSVIGCCNSLKVITEKWEVITTDVKVSSDGNRIKFIFDNKTFTGNLRQTISNFKFKRVK